MEMDIDEHMDDSKEDAANMPFLDVDGQRKQWQSRMGQYLANWLVQTSTRLQRPWVFVHHCFWLCVDMIGYAWLCSYMLLQVDTSGKLKFSKVCVDFKICVKNVEIAGCSVFTVFHCVL